MVEISVVDVGKGEPLPFRLAHGNAHLRCRSDFKRKTCLQKKRPRRLFSKEELMGYSFEITFKTKASKWNYSQKWSKSNFQSSIDLVEQNDFWHWLDFQF